MERYPPYMEIATSFTPFSLRDDTLVFAFPYVARAGAHFGPSSHLNH